LQTYNHREVYRTDAEFLDAPSLLFKVTSTNGFYSPLKQKWFLKLICNVNMYCVQKPQV
jgi:hypothetical protein